MKSKENALENLGRIFKNGYTTIEIGENKTCEIYVEGNSGRAVAYFNDQQIWEMNLKPDQLTPQAILDIDKQKSY
jgi:hypothetical protein